jgi:hypothetical protein
MRDSGWMKSSFSAAASDNCVEVRWVKSSFSGAATDNCVEVRLHPTTVGIRDSKNPAATLSVPPAAWLAYITATTGS